MPLNYLFQPHSEALTANEFDCLSYPDREFRFENTLLAKVLNFPTPLRTIDAFCDFYDSLFNTDLFIET